MAAGLLAADAPLDAADAARLVPAAYRHRLIQQLSLVDDKAAAWTALIARINPDHRDALAFLLANMPADDLKSLSPERVEREIALAYDARAATPWARRVPDAIFLNDVLPYANTSEARDPWRQDFRARFAPLVKDCKSASDAAQLLNREIFKTLNVAYHATKRRKPDQSPKESMETGFASCTGLSILLADACRAVGVPARVVGTPLWADGSGNHTWVEIWDGQWWFVGAAEPGPLNDTWFKEPAAKANAASAEHSIYAASFRQTTTPFVAVWAPDRHDLFAENVSNYYAKRTADTAPALDGDWAAMSPLTPRGYVCRRVAGPIKIDGRGGDPAWALAPWTEDFADIQGPARPSPRFRTRVKMLWDTAYLYVHAEMEEPHVWATIRDKNKVIFQDNDFEIFIDPDGDHQNYHEIEINPFNTIWELSLPKPYRDGGKPIDPDNIAGLMSVVHINGTINDPSDTDRGWSLDVAIPWAGLTPYAGRQACPPRDGEQWRINFSRVQWLADIIDGRYRKIPKAMRDEDNWVWSPQGVIYMHRPERWGFVQFSDSDATAAFKPDASLPARDQLMRVYYRQANFRKTAGRYAMTLDELGLSEAQRQGVTLKPADGGYIATVTSADGKSISIDADSRITRSAGKK